ncbi:hypothetical protein AMTRI_Chr08g208350 [Amborella trichopoda]
MTTLPLFSFLLLIFTFIQTWVVNHALGMSSTLAVIHATGTVCGIMATVLPQSVSNSVVCYRGGDRVLRAAPSNVSFSGISGGNNTFCGIVSGGSPILCWDTAGANLSDNFAFRRLSKDRIFRSLSVGEGEVCGLGFAGVVECWRGGGSVVAQFASITAGDRFMCGILSSGFRVRCWGSSGIGGEIEAQFSNLTMSSLVAGGSHACGFRRTDGALICRGRNESGQLNVPPGASESQFSSLALGSDHSCAMRSSNGTVVCWGGGSNSSLVLDYPSDEQFLTIVAGGSITCGLTRANFSVICWGSEYFRQPKILPLPLLIPGPCTSVQCPCELYLNSQRLCSGNQGICEPCSNHSPPPLFPPPPPQPPPPPTTNQTPTKNNGILSRGLLAFAIIGSVGAFISICTLIYHVWTGKCFRQKKVHNSVQPTVAAAEPPSRSSSTGMRRQGSRAMRRQRSGTSSSKHGGCDHRAEDFLLAELEAATDGFSPANKIGAGSFGAVYKGKLPDGREVAIKRGDTTQARRFQEKESAFRSELSFLSRLHHKHLVSLVGFCEEQEERLLVYEYMHNGALYDHLHTRQEPASPVHSWKMRIKMLLDAARGIEYLHTYAVPPIIHRDVKSSNILLDKSWTARVSDLGLSLRGPDGEGGYLNMAAAGTVGYMDPEYYGLQQLTTKSDVYGLGVVILEVLTGKRAVYRDGNGEVGVGGGEPSSVVDVAVPRIMAGEVGAVLDARVEAPVMGEAEAVELVALMAVQCVRPEGRDRPTMTNIVANLDRAFNLCTSTMTSHGSISFSLPSE